MKRKPKANKAYALDAADQARLLRLALATPQPGVSTGDVPPNPADGPMPAIDGYHLLAKIGEGGMAEVFAAEQMRPVHRKVAVKIIQLGMNSRQVISRFNAERQILAMLEHPCIARIFDAGTTATGRPYFAMEYVDGVPITRYCDEHAMPVGDRLALFMQVCGAVQYAHQRGIIHRDLKPSNVLVVEQDDGAVPKIIDFGIAKATDQAQLQQTFFTERGQLIGTPEYMSPEQARFGAHEVDTRSDIYSLGVILYEMLVGVLPFDRTAMRKAALGEIQRIIAEEQPPRPSTRLYALGDTREVIAQKRTTRYQTLSKTLRHELEWIPLKAMRKEPAQRYQSAGEMARDIRNYLAGDPLMAGPESLAYRLRKTVLKYRKTVVAAAAVFAALVIGLVASTWLYVVAESQRQRAEHNLDQVERLAYCSAIQAVHAKVKGGDYAGVRQMLADTDPSRRGWEWGYLMNMCQIPDWTFQADARINGLCVSGDGRHIGLVVDYSSALLLEAATRRILWNRRFSADSANGHCAFDADGGSLIVLSGGALYVLDVETGEQTAVCEGLGGECFCLSPDGETVYMGSRDKKVHRLDRATWKVLQTTERSDFVRCVAIDEANRVLGAVSGLGTLSLHDADTLEAIAAKGKVTGEGVRDLLLSSRLSLLLASGGYGFYTNTLAADQDVRGTHGGGHTQNVGSMDLNADHTRLVTGSWDGTAKVFDANSLELMGTLYHDFAVSQAVFAPGGKILTAGFDGRLMQWSGFDVASAEARTPITFAGSVGVWDLDYRSDGRMIVYSAWGYEGLHLYDTRAGTHTELKVQGREKDLINDGRPVTLFRPGTSQLVVEADNSLRVHDTVAAGFPEVRRITPSHPVVHAAFSPDGRRLAMSYDNDIIGVIDFEAGMDTEQTCHIPEQKVSHLVISPDNRRLAALEVGGQRRIILWDIQTGKHLRSIKTSFTSYSQGLAFEPSGRYIAAGDDHGLIEMWDTQTGELLKRLKGHGYNVVANLQFSRDGSRLLSAGQDNTLRLWDWRLGRELLVLAQGFYVLDAQFSPDESCIAAADGRPVTAWLLHARPWQTSPVESGP